MSALATFNLTITLIAVAASPGPGVFATIATSMSVGFQSCLSFIAGIVAGHVIFLLMAAFGLSLIANAIGDFFYLVKVVGGLYLIFIGVKIIAHTPANPDPNRKNPIQSCTGIFLRGLLVTFSNPKAILLYCGILPSLFGISRLSMVDLAMVTFIVVIVFSVVLGGYALAAIRASRMFSSRSARRKLNQTAGVIMIAVGTGVITRS